jgi:hypothetical protein
MSETERGALAHRIADFINGHDLNNPFGGEVAQMKRYYGVACSMPRGLDGDIRVYGLKFIQVLLVGPLVHGERREVFDREENALAFLKALLVDFDSEAADAVPTLGTRS